MCMYTKLHSLFATKVCCLLCNCYKTYVTLTGYTAVNIFIMVYSINILVTIIVVITITIVNSLIFVTVIITNISWLSWRHFVFITFWNNDNKW